MDTSIFCFATDLADEGIEAVLDNVEHRGGLGGVTVAAAYHEGRDVFPHNPVRRVRFLESGAVFFPPGPAIPDARAYARALAADIAALGVAGICSEALHYLGLEHGYAHERYFVSLGPRTRYLLGLCFCRHCLDAARRPAAPHATRSNASSPAAPSRRSRSSTATSSRSTQECANRSCRPLSPRSPRRPARRRSSSSSSRARSRATPTGRPTGAPSPSIAWQFGVDVDAVARACDGIEAIGYAADPERIRGDLDAYGKDAVSVIFRPSTPDCDSAEDLRAKVDLARSRDLRRVDFYHYGLMRLDALDWIHSALGVD